MNAILSAAQQSLSNALRSNRFITGQVLLGTKEHKSFRETIAAGAVARGIWPQSICPVWLAYLLDAIFLACPVSGAAKHVGGDAERISVLKNGAMRLMHEMSNWSAMTDDKWKDVRRHIIAGLLDDVSRRPMIQEDREDGWTVLQTLMGGLAGYMRTRGTDDTDSTVVPSYRHPTVIEDALALELEIALFKDALTAVDDDAPAAMAAFFEQYLRAITSLAGSKKTPGQYRVERENGALVALTVVTNAIARNAPDRRDERLSAA